MSPDQCPAMLAHKSREAQLIAAIAMMKIAMAVDQCDALMVRVRPSEVDSASARQDMLGCIEAARRGIEVPA